MPDLASQSWFRVENAKKAGEPAEVHIMDEIGLYGITAADFAAALKPLRDSKTPIDVYFTTPGGNPFHGQAMYDELKRHTAQVRGFVQGLCASSGTIPACACDPLSISAGSLFIIHNPSAPVRGTAKDHRGMADFLDKAADTIATVYEKKTGKPRADIKAAMDAETIMSAEQAKEWGFADAITDAVPVAASFDPLKYVDNFAPHVQAAMQQIAATFSVSQTPVLDASAPTEPGVGPITEEQAMPEPKTGEAMTLDRLRADYKELVQAIEKDAVIADRARATSIRAAAEDFQSELAEKMVNDGTPELEALRALSADRKAKSADKLAQLREMEANMNVPPNREQQKPKPEKAEDAEAVFDAKVSAHLREHKCSYEDAIKAVRNAEPELWAKVEG